MLYGIGGGGGGVPFVLIGSGLALFTSGGVANVLLYGGPS